MIYFALERFPKLDLHGEYSTTIYTLIHEFIKEQVKLKEKYIIIIHGKGTGVLKKEVQKILKNEPLVEEFNLDPNNLGQTIVKLRER